MDHPQLLKGVGLGRVGSGWVGRSGLEWNKYLEGSRPVLLGCHLLGKLGQARVG